jgi:uncharacterized membrane protein YkvA (DUF1232 family)
MLAPELGGCLFCVPAVVKATQAASRRRPGNDRKDTGLTVTEVRAIERWKSQVRQLKGETYALYLAYRDPRVPWYAKALAICVVGYAFSPIDLIPDFIPILGYLDDLVLVPLGMILAHRMIPQTVLEECREKAQQTLSQDEARSWVAGGVIMAIWLLLMALVIVVVVRAING